MRLLQQSLKLAQSIPDNDLLVTQIFNSLGIVNYWQGKYAKAEDFFSKALLLITTSGIPFDLSELLNNLGAVYVVDRKFEQAEQILNRALAIREAQVGGSHPDLISTLDGLGMLYSSTGKYSDAMDAYSNIQVSRGALTPSALAVHAAVLAANGRADDAAAEMRELGRAATIARRNLGRHPEMATILEDYSTVLRKQGKAREAEELRGEAKRARIASGLVINAHSPQ